MESCAVQSKSSCGSAVNVGEGERFISVAAGTLLTSWALKHLTSINGLVALAAGGALVHRGVTGHCAMYAALESQEAQSGQSGKASRQSAPPEFGRRPDPVEEAGRQSFPASDSPAWSGASEPGGTNPLRYRAH